MDAIALLDEFFSHFFVEEAKYSCLFLGEGPFEMYSALAESFGIKASAHAPMWALRPEQRQFLDSKLASQTYVLVENIKANSPARAHAIAAACFEEFEGVARFFMHRLSFSRSSLSLVRRGDNQAIYRIHDSPDPMHCWVSHTTANEQEMLAFVAATHGNHLAASSADKLRRALRLHRSALLSNSAENQLIDLWAALEGVVSRPGKESQRLEFFSECLLPAITLSYPEKIFTSIYRDLTKLSPSGKAVAMRLAGDDSGLSKFIRLILCREHGALREDLIAELLPQPLLLNKVYRISHMFESRAACRKNLKRHREKVGWHLARIYHTRNSIMHDARTLPHLPTLVENLHVYVDTLIKAIQRAANLAEERITIDGAIQYISVWERHRLQGAPDDGAKDAAAPCDTDVWSIVFGDGLMLAPDPKTEPMLPNGRKRV